MACPVFMWAFCAFAFWVCVWVLGFIVYMACDVSVAYECSAHVKQGSRLWQRFEYSCAVHTYVVKQPANALRVQFYTTNDCTLQCGGDNQAHVLHLCVFVHCPAIEWQWPEGGLNISSQKQQDAHVQWMWGN